MRGWIRSWWPILAIVVGVLAANAVNLLLVHPDPALVQSKVATEVQPGFISGLYTIDPFDGFITQALGKQAASQWLQGDVPWWNSYEGIGAPLAGELQAAALFPLVLLMALPSGILLMHIALQLIAGLATYALLRRLEVQKLMAGTGALAFACNGTFAWLGNATVNPVAFLPLLLLGIEYARAATVQQRSGGWMLIGAATALSLYSGFPETAAVNALFAVLWYGARNSGLDWQLRKQYAKKVVAGGAAGLLVSVPVLAAFATYYPDANVGIHATEITGGLPAFGIAALVFPYIFGPIFGFADPAVTGWWGSVGGFVTVPLVFLAILGVWRGRYRLLSAALAAWVIVMVLRTYDVPGVAEVLNLIPGVSAIAMYRYAFPAIELAVVVLAAFGLQAALRQTVPRRHILFAGGVVAGVLVLVLCIAWPQMRQLSDTAPNYQWWVLLSVGWAAGTTAVLAVLLLLRRIRIRLAPVMVCGIVVVDIMLLFALPQLSAPRSGRVDMAPITFLQQHLGTYRYFTLGPIAPNYGSYYGIASVNSNNLPVPAKWTDHITAELDPYVEPAIHFTGDRETDTVPTSQDMFLKNIAAYEEVGTKYVVTHPGQLHADQAASAGLHQVFQSKTATIYELRNPAPYFAVAAGDCSLHPQGIAEVHVRCKQGSTLVRRELWLPGWRAHTATGAVQVGEHEGLFQRVALPAGESTVRFAYTPPYTNLAVLAAGVGVGIFGYGIWLSRRQWMTGLRKLVRR